MGPLRIYQGSEIIINIERFLAKFGLNLETFSQLFYALFLNAVLISINLILLYLLVNLLKSFKKTKP